MSARVTTAEHKLYEKPIAAAILPSERFERLFQAIGSIPKNIETSHVITIIRRDIFEVSLLKWICGCRIAKYL